MGNRTDRLAEKLHSRNERMRANAAYAPGGTTGLMVLAFMLAIAVGFVMLRPGYGIGGEVFLACFVFVAASIMHDNNKAVQQLRRTVDDMARELRESREKDKE